MAEKKDDFSGLFGFFGEDLSGCLTPSLLNCESGPPSPSFMDFLNKNNPLSGSLSDIGKSLRLSSSSPPEPQNVETQPHPLSNQSQSLKKESHTPPKMNDSSLPPHPQSNGSLPNPSHNGSPHPPRQESNESYLPPLSNEPQRVSYDATRLAPQLPPSDQSQGVGPVRHRSASRATRKTLPVIMCRTCGKWVKNLPQHMRTHGQRKQYVCSVCNKGFNHQQNLTQHMRLHRDEEPFLCKYCGRSFNDNANCKRHEHLHEKKKKEEEELDRKRKEEELEWKMKQEDGLEQPRQSPEDERNIREDLYKLWVHSCRYCGMAFVLHREKQTHEEQRCPDRQGAPQSTKGAKRTKTTPRVTVAETPRPTPSPIDLTTTSAHWHQPVSSAYQQSAQTSQAATSQHPAPQTTTSPALNNVHMSVLLVKKSPSAKPVQDCPPSQTPLSRRPHSHPTNLSLQTPEAQQFLAQRCGSWEATPYTVPDTTPQSRQQMVHPNNSGVSIPNELFDLQHLAQAVTPHAPPPCPPPYPMSLDRSQLQNQPQQQQYVPHQHSMMAMNDSGYISTDVSPIVGNPRRSSYC